MRDLQHYSIGEVAALLGVSPHAIRAWERRYGILSPERGLNRHRRYSAEDIEFLRDVKRTADVNGTSLRLALEVVNGSLELGSTAGTPMRHPTHVDNPEAADSHLPSDVWRAVGDVVPNLIMLLDADGVVVEANVAVARLLGVVRQRVAGLKFIGLVDPFDRMKASMLYRPQMRAVSSWELNLETKDGPRLFSFSAWPVASGETTYLAVIGSEMFRRRGRTEADARLAGAVRGVGEPSTIHALQELFDRLPVGVAVATVGTEPHVVYSNRSLNPQLGLPAGSLMGRRVSDLLGQELFHESPPAGSPGRTRKGPRLTTRKTIVKTNDELRAVFIRPMFSANDTVTSYLIVVMPQAPATDQKGGRTSSSIGL